LRFLEASQRVLLTDNRQSMQGHVAAHHDAGHRHWGIFVVRIEVPLGRLIEELVLYWEASEADEWIDRVEWLAV
jgi:hypothetical protein